METFKDKGIQVEKSTNQGFVLLLYTIGSSVSKTGNLYHLLLQLERNAIEKCLWLQQKNSVVANCWSQLKLVNGLLTIERPTEGFHYYFYNKDKVYKTLKEIKDLIINGQKVFNCHLIVPYPPGIPILIPGTEITKDKCNYLSEITAMGGEIHGLRDDKIAVIIKNKQDN